MAEETCKKCGMPIEKDEDKCTCEEGSCCHCCSCADDCQCGCQKKGE